MYQGFFVMFSHLFMFHWWAETELLYMYRVVQQSHRKLVLSYSYPYTGLPDMWAGWH